MRSELLASAVLASVFVSGCDFFWSNASKAEIMKLEQKKAEQDAIQKQDAAAALRAYISGRCQLVIDDATSVSNAIAVLGGDAARLEKAVSAGMGTAGGDGESQTAVAALTRTLRDPVVNELAQKYLLSGFAVQCELFVARAKAATEAERAYRAAIQQVQQSFERSVGAAGKWQSDTSSGRDTEIRRLRLEIAALEKKLKSERKKLQGNETQERERNANVRDYEDQIETKRAQVDRLRNPTQSNRIENNAAEAQLQVRSRAQSIRYTEMQDAERHFKPKETAIDVIRETEAQTIGALRREIGSRKGALVVRLAELAKLVRLSREALLEVSVCDEGELRQLRTRMDRAFAAATK